MSRRADDALLKRAEAWGVSPHFVDFRGNEQVAPPTSIAQVLEAMGADTDEPPEPTTIVCRPDLLPDPAGFLAIRFEDGEAERVDGRWPDPIPFGYHLLTDRDGREQHLIVSPGACVETPALPVWGWGLQLYSLRSHRSWGIGDLGVLRDFGRWSRSTSAGVTMINPLFAAGPWSPHEASPYSPATRRFLDLLYLRVEDVANSAGVDITEFARRGIALNASPTIDRDAVRAVKLEALEWVWATDPPRLGFDLWRQREGESLDRFATFTTLAEVHGGVPSGWPEGLRHRGSPEVENFSKKHAERVLFHQWIQWLLDVQLEDAARETTLINDLPVGVDGEGFDLWSWPDAFAARVSIGAPPDEFNAHGQDWGMPPLDPWKLQQGAHDPFVHSIRGGLRHAGAVRIDHVMGLFRLYWIPEGREPTEGVYVRYPHRELLDIVALESHRAGAYVIGEDLGTVEPHVREEMATRSMLSYRIMWFENDPPDRYPQLALAAVTNHDLPTIAGFWSGEDLEEQSLLGLDPDVDATSALRERVARLLDIAPDAPVRDVIVKAYETLARAPSRVVLATLEDALEVRRRPNQPGTGRQRPNWSIPLPATLEELPDASVARSIARAMRVRATGP